MASAGKVKVNDGNKCTWHAQSKEKNPHISEPL
jgi:hypothetical protein